MGSAMSAAQHLARIGERHIVHPRAAIGDQALGLLAGFREARAGDELRHGNAVADLCRAERERGQILARAALLEDLARRGLGGIGGRAPWQSVVTSLASTILASLISDPPARRGGRIPRPAARCRA
jgi:hypothetical protein